jgi:uncharacterized protein
MRKNKLKIIIDTNLWISFLISKKLKWLDSLILDKNIRLIFSKEVLDEFISVAARPKFSKYFADNDVDELFRLLSKYSSIISVESSAVICRDPKDNFLLSLAIDSKADYLITGDEDLLQLGTIGRTSIVTILQFKQKFS